MEKTRTMTNTSMNVSLPETLKEYVEERVAEGIYSNPSDYVRSLIREDMKRHSQERLEVLLLEGINSGPAEPMTDEDWAEIGKEAQRRAGTASKQV
jgi:antitoxin ParD1/3/4